MNLILCFVFCYIVWPNIVIGRIHETSTEHIDYPMETYGLDRNCGLRDPGYRVGDNTLRKYPWLVKILYNDPTISSCGGVLITDYYVLTTKECIVSNYVAAVLMGEYSDTTLYWKNVTYTIGDRAQRIFVHYKVEHPTRNVGLLNLQRRAILTDYVRPICLPWCKKVLRKKHGDISGWTYYSRKSKIMTNAALHTNIMHIIPSSECLKGHGWENEEFCAEGRNEGDSCRGMPGGPFMMTEKVGHVERFVVVGLQIAEQGVCGTISPMTFVNVTYNMDWVLDNIEYIY